MSFVGDVNEFAFEQKKNEMKWEYNVHDFNMAGMQSCGSVMPVSENISPESHKNVCNIVFDIDRRIRFVFVTFANASNWEFNWFAVILCARKRSGRWDLWNQIFGASVQKLKYGFSEITSKKMLAFKKVGSSRKRVY